VFGTVSRVPASIPATHVPVTYPGTGTAQYRPVCISWHREIGESLSLVFVNSCIV